MTQQTTTVMDNSGGQVPVTPPVTPPAGPAGPRKKRRGAGKTIAAIVIIAAVVAAVALLLYFKVFRTDNSKGKAMTDVASIGSIQSIVEGSGTTKAKDSATITPNAGGTVLELYVKEGDKVEAGQQLYRMDDAAAQQAVADAQKTVDNCAKELQAIYDAAKDLTIRAPHAGKLMDVADTLKVGDDVAAGTKIATVADDTRLKLSLYFNYAYEGQISAGQSAQVSVPAIMGQLTGTVEKVNLVRFISPEGGVYFEAVIVVDNPGTLTQDMEASATLAAADGTPIYPYQGGQLKYYQVSEITAKTAGPA